MPQTCIVPKCNRNFKNSLKKRSLFRVPRDPEEARKWELAIPGKMSLSYLRHHVCEMHFEPQFIVRKWIKHDNNGRIIAEVAYAHPKLVPGAVPTIFINNPPDERYGVSIDNKEQNEIIICNDVDSQDGSLLETSNSANDESSEPILNDFGPGAVEEEIVITSPSEQIIETNSSINPTTVNKNIEVVSLLEPEVEIETMDTDGVQNDIHVFSITNTCEHSQKPEVITSKKEKNSFYQCALVYEKIRNLCLSHRLPPPWTYLEMTHWAKNYIVFHYTVMRGLEPNITPSVQRSVVISEKCRVDYFLYGGKIPVKHLPDKISNAEYLLNILEMFEKTSLETR